MANTVTESTRFNCRFYLRSSLRYSMIDTLPDIGNDDIVTLQYLRTTYCTYICTINTLLCMYMLYVYHSDY